MYAMVSPQTHVCHRGLTTNPCIPWSHHKPMYAMVSPQTHVRHGLTTNTCTPWSHHKPMYAMVSPQTKYAMVSPQTHVCHGLTTNLCMPWSHNKPMYAMVSPQTKYAMVSPQTHVCHGLTTNLCMPWSHNKPMYAMVSPQTKYAMVSPLTYVRHGLTTNPCMPWYHHKPMYAMVSPQTHVCHGLTTKPMSTPWSNHKLMYARVLPQTHVVCTEHGSLVDLKDLNPSNAKANCVLSTRMQRIWKPYKPCLITPVIYKHRQYGSKMHIKGQKMKANEYNGEVNQKLKIFDNRWGRFGEIITHKMWLKAECIFVSGEGRKPLFYNDYIQYICFCVDYSISVFTLIFIYFVLIVLSIST